MYSLIGAELPAQNILCSVTVIIYFLPQRQSRSQHRPPKRRILVRKVSVTVFDLLPRGQTDIKKLGQPWDVTGSSENRHALLSAPRIPKSLRRAYTVLPGCMRNPALYVCRGYEEEHDNTICMRSDKSVLTEGATESNANFNHHV